MYLLVRQTCLLSRGANTLARASSGHGGHAPLACTDTRSIAAAVTALRNDDVVAVPTDTLYGLAASANSAAGIKKLYNIKGRDAKVPLAVCVADPQDVARYARTEHVPHGLLEQLLPGPVTVVLERLQGALCDSLNPGVLGIGIRVPDSTFIRRLAREFGGALALTSANLSGAPSSLTVNEFEHLWPECACVFDGGQMPPDRRGSTIVDLCQAGTYHIIRDGSALPQVTAMLTKAGLSKRG